MKSWGLVLMNLGTPDSTSTSDVRRYLREFLSDPRVIDIHPVGRWMLLNLIILPFRPKQSAHAYQQIWTERGSPLLFHAEDLAEKVRARLGGDVPVVLAMRYGNPSVEAAVEELRRQGVDRIVLFPMFPQFSTAAWGSAVAWFYEVLSRGWNTPTLHVVPPFYEEPSFVAALGAASRPTLDDMRPERVLMSFHGVPERHVTKSEDVPGTCLKPGCCDRITEANRNCYRAQCYATARALASELGLEDGTWEVTFQSRLGKTPWIRPYTDERLTELQCGGLPGGRRRGAAARPVPELPRRVGGRRRGAEHEGAFRRALALQSRLLNETETA
jgi:ferrochelatase